MAAVSFFRNLRFSKVTKKDIANSRCLHELKHKCSAPNYYIKSTNINEKLKSVKRPLNCFKKNKKIIILRLELKQIFTL